MWGEPGGRRVGAVLDGAFASTVSLAEIAAKMGDHGIDRAQSEMMINELVMPFLPFDEAQAVLSGLLRPITRHRGLSLGDRCCLALAMDRGVGVMTADRAWAGLDLGIPIEVIR
jgi:PIN domain nuclease of toxin-antitoxin system